MRQRVERVPPGSIESAAIDSIRSARRYAYAPTFTNDNLGFRVALVLV